MMQGGGTELLQANGTWLGPGGESVYMGSGKEPDLIVFHAYDATTGKPSLQISTLTWQGDWPHAVVADEKNH
jgi:arabinan endo-1,5-alpha-L-arabinosidase